MCDCVIKVEQQLVEISASSLRSLLSDFQVQPFRKGWWDLTYISLMSPLNHVTLLEGWQTRCSPR